jgi:hypothetical protein
MIYSICYSSDGKRIGSVSNNNINIWDAYDGNLIVSLIGHK